VEDWTAPTSGTDAVAFDAVGLEEDAAAFGVATAIAGAVVADSDVGWKGIC